MPTGIKTIVTAFIVGILTVMGFFTFYADTLSRAEEKYIIYRPNTTNETVMDYGSINSLKKDLEDLQVKSQNIGEKGIFDVTALADIPGAFFDVLKILFKMPNVAIATVNRGIEQAPIPMPWWFSTMIIIIVLISVVFAVLAIVFKRSGSEV